MNNVYSLFKNKKQIEDPDKAIETQYFHSATEYNYAWLPTKTQDIGWIWFIKYFLFRTQTGYDKHGYYWEVQAKTVTFSAMKDAKIAFLKKLDHKK